MVKRSRLTAMSIAQRHFRRTHIQYQAIGSGSHGDTFVAMKRPTANSDAPSKLVVVKLHAAGARIDAENNLRNEIEMLKRLAGQGQHRGIIAIVDYHLDNDVQWLTIPYYSGGDLEHFIRSFSEAVSNAFIWHTVYCVTDALHWLFYGMFPADAVPRPGWYAFHGDLCLPNLFLTPAASRSPANFPQIVIADFGSAEVYTQLSQRSIGDFVKQQALDLCFFGNYSVNEMTKVAQRATDRSTQELDYWAAHFHGLTPTVDSWLSVPGVLNLLRSFHGAAAVRRLENLQPLPCSVVDTISAVPTLYEHK